MVTVFLFGCSAGPKNFENENDRLRAENMKLTEQVSALTARVDGLSKQLDARQKAAGVELPDGLHAPTCTSITIGRYTGRADDKDVVRVYLTTLDAQQRFVQTIGQATIQIVAIPADGNPVTVSQASYSPKQFDAAYRSGFMGTHYTLEAPLPTNVPEGVSQLTLKVTLKDVLTGLTLEAEKTLPAK